jgi:ElaB/YqjD/DUF883 family membrane-anchored ribosome-binding protein
VTPTVADAPDKTPEQIEREMEQTRESLTEKVAALENQVLGTVQSAADTLTDTVAAVKSMVSEAPAAVSDTFKHAAEAVSESVRNTFDITSRVRNHPWAAVGSAALLGCIASWLLTGRRGSTNGYAPSARGAAPEAAASVPTAARAAEAAPGLLDDLWGMIGAQGKELARSAFESVSAAIKQNIQETAPKLVSDAASRLTGSDTPEAPTYAGAFDSRRARA